MTATSCDAVLGGLLSLRQPLKGHRIGLDSMLLANMVRSGGRVADFGAGVGGAGLAFAVLNPAATLLLVERQPDLAALARENVASNGMAGRVSVAEADLFAAQRRREEAGLARESFGLVLTNPPFDVPGRTRPSPDAGRRQAHVLEGGDLDGWMRAAAGCAVPGGTIALIHRADRVHDVVTAMAGRFGGLSLRFVHASGTSPAIRVLVVGRKGSRRHLQVLAPVFVAASPQQSWHLTPDSAPFFDGQAASA